MAADGGCADAVDPELDARQAHPCWLDQAPADWWVRASAGEPGVVGAVRFDLWRIPGRKALSLSERGLALRARAQSHATQAVHAVLASDVGDGLRCDCFARWRGGHQGRLDRLEGQVRMFAGERPRVAFAHGATRAGLLHLRALQACDALRSGASQRDIAQALFGDGAVAGRWHADGELRAQVRHLLRRARAFIDGGYLALAGVVERQRRTPGDGDPGDESGR